jgi:hypothetical protein
MKQVFKTKVLAAVLTIVALLTGQQAIAESNFFIYGPTVSGNTARFRIERNGSSDYVQTVYYRTVSLTAYAGQHYTAVSGQLQFGPNDNTKYVDVEELTPTNNAFIYQKDMTERSYKLEVTDRMGIPYEELVRTITNSGTSINPSTAYDPHTYTLSSSQFLITDKGFDKNTYKTLSSSNFFTAAAVPQGYLTTAGSEVRATFAFDVYEMEDGYQHFQVLVDNLSTCDTDNNNVNCGTPNKSRYLVSMAHVPGTLDDTPKNYTFPLTQYGDFTDPVDNPWGPRPGWPSKVYSQKFKSGCRASDGRLILPNTFSVLVLRFDASGNNADDWYAKNLVTNMQNVDEYAPRQISITVNPGRHARRNPFYVTVAFNEIVTLTETPTLTTNWGTLEYVAGDNTNVLTFAGRIPDNAPGSLIVTGYTGTIEDLAGNAVTGGISAAGLASLDADLTYTLNDFKRDSQGNYLIITHDDLHGLASYTKTYSTAGLSFLQVCDIRIPFMGDYYTDFYDNNYTEDNFNGIGYPYAFQGTYDGGGHDISRVRMHKAGDRNVGLFRQIGQGGVVHSINLGFSYVAGYENVGGIAGCVEGGTIEDCTAASCYIRAVQENSSCHGGIAGLLTGTNATVQRCVSMANLSYASGLTNCSKFGGIVGSVGQNTTVSDNIATGATIPNVKARGAIAGCQSNATFTNNYYQSCKVAGTSDASNVGIGTNGSTTSADQDGARLVYAITLASHTAFDRTLSATLPNISTQTHKTYNNGAKIGSQHYIYATAPIHVTYDRSNIEEGNAFALNITLTDNNNAVAFTNNDDYTYDFTMPAAAVTITTTQAPGISYIDAAGKERWLFLSDCQEIYPHIGTLVYKGQEKWFYVKPGEHNFDVCINIVAAQANIIFCDGAIANFSMQPQGIYNYSPKDGGYEGGGIAIYGQKEGNAIINIQDGQGGKIEALGDIDINGCNVIVNDYELSYAILSDTGNVTIRRGNVTTYNTYSGIFARQDVNILGGTVNAIGGEEVWSTSAIYAQGNVNILGGKVTAIGEGNVPGIQAGYNGDGTITLGWTNFSDRITADAYVCGTINVQDGQTLYDGNALYTGDITNSTDNIKDKTLIPYIANATTDDGTGILYDKDAGLPEGHRNADRITALADGNPHNTAILGRTLYKDNAWNTLCLPFGLNSFGSTPLENATVMTLGNSTGCTTGFDDNTGILTLDFVPAYAIEPGVAYIVKWDGDGTDNLVTPVFQGVTISNEAPADHGIISQDGTVNFIGTYGYTAFTEANKSILFMGDNNKLYYPGAGAEIGALRSYFQLNGITAGTPSNGGDVKAFLLNFGEDNATGIRTTDNGQQTTDGENIYNVAGQRLNKVQKGINIVNGKKVLF